MPPLKQEATNKQKSSTPLATVLRPSDPCVARAAALFLLVKNLLKNPRHAHVSSRTVTCREHDPSRTLMQQRLLFSTARGRAVVCRHVS